MMRWIYVVQDDGKDGAFLGAFEDEKDASEYAEHIGAAKAYRVPLFPRSYPLTPRFSAERGA